MSVALTYRRVEEGGLIEDESPRSLREFFVDRVISFARVSDNLYLDRIQCNVDDWIALDLHGSVYRIPIRLPWSLYSVPGRLDHAIIDVFPSRDVVPGWLKAPSGEEFLWRV